MSTQRHIAIAAIAFDPSGAQVLPLRGDKAGLREGSRRCAKTATLDGGCVVHDSGYSAADRTMEVETDIEFAGWLEYMVQTYRLVRVATAEGFYTAIPSRYKNDGETANITLDFTEQLA